MAVESTLVERQKVQKKLGKGETRGKAARGANKLEVVDMGCRLCNWITESLNKRKQKGHDKASDLQESVTKTHPRVRIETIR